MNIKLLFAALSAVAISMPAFAQTAVKPGAAVDPKLAECTNKAKAAHKEVMDIYNAAKALGDIDPKELAEFRNMEMRLPALGAETTKPMTLAQCDAVSKKIADEKVAVVRMATVDPKLTECRANTAANITKILADYDLAKAAGKISATDETKFKAWKDRVYGFRSLVPQKTVTLETCQKLGRDITNEIANLERLLPDPAVAACIMQNQALQKEVTDMFNKAKAAGDINRTELTEFTRMEASLKSTLTRLQAGGLTLAECNKVGTALNDEKTKVAKMAVVDPALATCRTENAAAHKALADAYAKAKAAGKIARDEEATFRSMEARITRMENEAKKSGQTLADCKTLSNTIKADKTAVDRMAK